MVLILFVACNEYTSKPLLYRQSIAIDTVYSFIPGTGQNSGQDSLYFPQNIFGNPDKRATKVTPANDPNQILSLGLGGEIIVGFKNYFIVNGEGSDFIIFENAFVNPLNGKVFAEPGRVSVSKDEINYIDFPFDSLTLQGCAGITPTFWNKKYPLNSGGDKFDLNDIGLDTINYIKIKDISQMLLDNPEHPFYDVTISGFDLDAVIGINYVKK